MTHTDTMTSRSSSTRPATGQILTGSLFNEPMRVETVAETRPGRWTVGLVGTRSESFRRVELGPGKLAGLTVLDSTFRYDGDGALLRLRLQGLFYQDRPKSEAATDRETPPRYGDGEATDGASGTRPGATTLDRVHTGMLLQAGGQGTALRALANAEQEREPEFLRLANALLALYPRGSEERRLLDAMLLEMRK